VHVCVPLELPVTLPHEKPLTEFPTERKAPGFESVTVTVLPPDEAVTPMPTGHRLIAAATFEARLVVLESYAKVPLVELPHEFDPFEPAVTPPHEKMLVLFVALTEKVELPNVVEVTVTVLVLLVALTPAPAGHKLIAFFRFVARFVVLLRSVAKVPAVAIGQVFVPLVPAVVVVSVA